MSSKKYAFVWNINIRKTCTSLFKLSAKINFFHFNFGVSLFEKKHFKNKFKMYLNYLLIHNIRWNNYLNKNGDPKLLGKLVPKISPGTFLLVSIFFSGTFLFVPKSFKRLVMGPVWWSSLQWFPNEVEHSSIKINRILILLKISFFECWNIFESLPWSGFQFLFDQFCSRKGKTKSFLVWFLRSWISDSSNVVVHLFSKDLGKCKEIFLAGNVVKQSWAVSPFSGKAVVVWTT